MRYGIDLDSLPRRAAVAAVALAAIAVYLNSLANGFAYDDVYIIEKNTRVHDLWNLSQIWLTPYWPTFGSELGLYRPLAIFGYAVQWALGGGEPWLFHAVSIALHAAVAILVFLLLARLTTRGAGLVGGLAFAVHPVHTEAVANIVGQAELLAAGGVIAAALLYVDRRSGAEVRLGRTLAIAGLYACALAAKEHAIVLPGLMVCLDLAQRRIEPTRGGIWRYMRAVAPAMALLGAVAVTYLAFRVDILGSLAGSDANPSLPYLREEHRVLSAFRAWPEFARLLFFPRDLIADYSPAVILPVESWSPLTVLGAVLLAGTSGLALMIRARPSIGLPAAWFLVTILPVSNLLFPIGVLIAERTLYLPSLTAALCAAYAWQATSRSTTQRARHAAIAAAMIGFPLLGIRTIVRNPDWRDTRAVMDALLRDHPESYRAQWSAAAYALQAGDTVGSAEYWELAYRLWPRDSQLLAEFGIYNLQRDRIERGVAMLEESYSMHPNISRTIHMLARGYLRASRFDEVIELMDQLSRIEGPTPAAFEIRARALMGLERHQDAVHAWRTAIRLSRGASWEYWRMLAWAYIRAGDAESAGPALDTARTLAGNDADALAWVEKVAELLDP